MRAARVLGSDEGVSTRSIWCPSSYIPVSGFHSSYTAGLILFALDHNSPRMGEVKAVLLMVPSSLQSNRWIKYLECQYSCCSQAQWCDSQISVQQQNGWCKLRDIIGLLDVLVSMGKRPNQRDVSLYASWKLRLKCWMDRQREVIPKTRGARVKCSRTCKTKTRKDYSSPKLLVVRWSQRWHWLGLYAVAILNFGDCQSTEFS